MWYLRSAFLYGTRLDQQAKRGLGVSIANVCYLRKATHH